MNELVLEAKGSLQEKVDAVLNGEESSLELAVKLAAMENAIKEAKEQIKEVTLEELEKYENNTLKNDKVLITKTAGGRYSYKHIQEWVDLDKLKKTVEKKAQEAYKASLHGGSVVTDDGEVYEAAEYVPNKESISIKFI